MEHRGDEGSKNAYLDFLPQVPRGMGSLDGFHVQVAHTVLLPDGGVPAVGEGAGGLAAQTGDIVWVTAELISL